MKHGPFSSKRPMSESDPGPPFNHKVKGSEAGSLRDSKNQKKTWILKACLDGDYIYARQDTHVHQG